jgi:hypothetical protein
MTKLNKSIKIKLVTSEMNAKINTIPFPFSINTCKRAFTTRNIDVNEISILLTGEIKPKAGDLVLCEVTRLRQHCRIELINGRRSRMFVKDKIIVCYGDRYAPDQFESIVPDDLSACHLVAGGGIASKMRHKSPKVKPATEIQPIGLIGNNKGEVINLSDYKILQKHHIKNLNIPLFLVAGSSMNAGKTTTVANIIKGLVADGYEVGAAKVTGTGSGGDLWHFIDAGVKTVIDFTDAGYVSTYKVEMSQLITAFEDMVMHLQAQAVDAIVIEVADGLLQQETEQLLCSPIVQQATSGIFYSAGDSSSSIYGSKWLQQQGYHVIGVSGVVSSNPLAKTEVENNLTIPVFMKTDLTQAGFGHQLIENFKQPNSAALIK